MTFAFGRFTVRPVEERDRPMIEQRIAADPYHAGIDPDYFIRTMPGEEAWAIENEHGFVVLYFRTQVVARLALLFGSEGPDENRAAMTEGIEWLVDSLRFNRFRQVVFDTDSPDLRISAIRRLGFRPQRDLLVRAIPPSDADASLAAAWKGLPQASQDRG